MCRRQLVLRGDPLGHAGPIVQRVRSARGETGRPPLAIPHRLDLDAVLTERREVDHQVGRIEQPLSYVYELVCHERQAMGGLGRNRKVCRRNCRRICCGPVESTERSPELPCVHRLQLVLNQFFAIPTALIVAASGIYQMDEGNWNYGGGRELTLRNLPPEYQRRGRAEGIVGSIVGILLIAAIFMMATKPGL